MLSPEIITRRIQSLGTLPMAVTKLLELMRNPDASLSDFEKVVRPDPALTANLLRVANSAAYRGTAPLTNVKDALGRLGMRGVFEVVTASSLRALMPARLAGYDVDGKTFWRHSVAVGVLSDRLARAASVSSPHVAFTAGLLHDVGKLVIGAYLGDEAGAGVRFKHRRLTSVQAEREAFETDHAAVGKAIAEKWGLPSEIVGTTGFHHAPSEAPSASLRMLAATVHISDTLAHVDGFGVDGPTDALSIPSDLLGRLGIDRAKLDRVVRDALPEIERASA